jgi:hypothetical protein
MFNKQIIISGKNNKDKINSIETGEKGIRKGMENIEMTHQNQIIYINNLFLNWDTERNNNNNNNNNNNITKELEKKINGYKQQDIKKNIYQPECIIKYEDVLEKLVISKLRCFYCRNKIMVIYKNVRDPMQWTLDRKDNDDCHSKENTLISCLKCNLQRRVTDVDKFTFTKHLTIKKEY